MLGKWLKLGACGLLVAMLCRSDVSAQDVVALDVFLTGDGTQTTLWIGIKNRSDKTARVCSRGVDVVASSVEVAGASFATGEILPGCGTKGFDPWWLLLPGESRIDSIALEEMPLDSMSIHVSAHLLLTTSRTDAPVPVLASWEGTAKSAKAGEGRFWRPARGARERQ